VAAPRIEGLARVTHPLDQDEIVDIHASSSIDSRRPAQKGVSGEAGSIWLFPWRP
jgi:hypothetical protein